MVVGKDTLYIYGGMMEVKDKEVTLDDLYCLNLSKLDEWKCIMEVCYIFYLGIVAHWIIFLSNEKQFLDV